jgi:broad specificity phosphatase PhoE
MMRRVTLVAAAPTTAPRAARFPLDDGVEPGALEGLAPVPRRDGEECRHGPERRCVETARALGLESAPLERLRGWDLGSWAGRPIADVAAVEPDALAVWRGNPSAAPHDGETLTDLLERVAAWMEQPSDCERVVAVADASVVRAAVVHAMEVEWHAFWHLDVTPLSISVITHGRGLWRVRCMGAPTGPRGVLDNEG